MLVRFLTKYISVDDKEFEVNDVVNMSEDLVDHLSQVNAIEKVESEEAQELFAKLQGSKGLNDEEKETVNFVETEDRFHLRIDRDVDGVNNPLTFKVQKDLERRELS